MTASSSWVGSNPATGTITDPVLAAAHIRRMSDQETIDHLWRACDLANQPPV